VRSDAPHRPFCFSTHNVDISRDRLVPFDLRHPVGQNEVVSVLHIEDPRAQELASELARRTGETLSDVVIKSLEQRLAREGVRRVDDHLVDDLKEIARRSAALPVRDQRSADEILGYNSVGTFD